MRLVNLEVATHVHTSHTKTNQTCNGHNGLADNIIKARMDFIGLALAEHSSDPNLDPTNPQVKLSTSELVRAFEERSERIKVLADGLSVRDGLEGNLSPDGQIDVAPEVLKLVDYVVASQHGGLGESEKDPAQIAYRIGAAAANPHIDTIGHPNRYNDEVNGVDWNAIFANLLDTGTMAEINLNCYWKSQGSMRHWYKWLKAAYNTGVPLVVGFDVHNMGMWPTDTPTEEWHMPQAVLDGLLATMSSIGISPKQVLNSNLIAWNTWLDTPKRERVNLFSW